MIDKQVLCAKIRQMCPEVGDHDIELTVTDNKHQKARISDLKKDSQAVKRFRENSASEASMAGNQYESPGPEISRQIKNINGKRIEDYSCQTCTL